MALFQKISKTIISQQELFEKYFIIVSSINSLHLAPAEIKLLAFTAIKGNIAGAFKDQFCDQNNIPKASLGNLVHKLTKKGWLKKDGKKTIINPIIKISPSLEIVLNIKLNTNGAEGYSHTQDGLPSSAN